ncbi:MAG: hypothetical protein ACLU38_00210 [Dysosmobacter sp.]
MNLALITLKSKGISLYPLHGGSSGADAERHRRPLHWRDLGLRRGRRCVQAIGRSLDGLFAQG